MASTSSKRDFATGRIVDWQFQYWDGKVGRRYIKHSSLVVRDLPQLYLLPKKYGRSFDALRKKMSRHLSRLCTKTSLGKFLPKDLVPEWNMETFLLSQEVEAFRFFFKDSYELVCDEVKAEISAYVKEVWYSKYKEQGSPPYSFISTLSNELRSFFPAKRNISNVVQVSFISQELILLEEDRKDVGESSCVFVKSGTFLDEFARLYFLEVQTLACEMLNREFVSSGDRSFSNALLKRAVILKKKNIVGDQNINDLLSRIDADMNKVTIHDREEALKDTAGAMIAYCCGNKSRCRCG